MKIGDRVYVHGHIDEIRKDTVIIRNNGGYFGTVPSEVVTGELPSAQPEPSWDCEKCMMEHTDEMEKLEAELAIAKSKQPEPCEDAVSRQAAIDEIRKCRFVVDAIEKIRGLPSAQAEQKWIPCSERSPKKYGWYQVTLKDGRVNRLYYDYKSDRWIDNVRKHMFELYDIYSKSTHKRITEEKEDVYWDDWVIAWMPLPESYREEGEQNGKN